MHLGLEGDSDVELVATIKDGAYGMGDIATYRDKGDKIYVGVVGDKPAAVKCIQHQFCQDKLEIQELQLQGTLHPYNILQTVVIEQDDGFTYIQSGSK